MHRTPKGQDPNWNQHRTPEAAAANAAANLELEHDPQNTPVPKETEESPPEGAAAATPSLGAIPKVPQPGTSFHAIKPTGDSKLDRTSRAENRDERSEAEDKE